MPGVPAGFSSVFFPAWLDTYMNYHSWHEYFRPRPGPLPQHSTLIKGRFYKTNASAKFLDKSNK